MTSDCNTEGEGQEGKNDHIQTGLTNRRSIFQTILPNDQAKTWLTTKQAKRKGKKSEKER